MPKAHEPQKLSHYRLASKAAGDDISFSRYIKIPGRGVKKARPSSPRLPSLELPAVREGRTYFGRSVKQPDAMTNLLVSGHSNIKIGRDVRIGKLRGYWLYTLSLEERKTCPRACHHWQNCYGNSMPYAKRVDHTHPEFRDRLLANIDRLLAVKGRRGIIVRLHALGDFFDVAYVQFWQAILTSYSNVVVFGYTAWLPGTPIGDEIARMIDLFPGRAMMRFSNGGMSTRSTVPIVQAEDCPPGAFVCPEQTGQFDACGKCGACWATLKNVAFMAH